MSFSRWTGPHWNIKWPAPHSTLKPRAKSSMGSGAYFSVARVTLSLNLARGERWNTIEQGGTRKLDNAIIDER